MSHHIASAIILSTILDYLNDEQKNLEGHSILCCVPGWFTSLHPKEKFTKPEPDVPNPHDNQEIVDRWIKDPCYDLPDHLMEYQKERRRYTTEKAAWEHAQDLILLRKWVFWCADFCDIQQDFTLKYRYQS